MNVGIYNTIKKEYDKRQKNVYDRLNERKSEIYLKIPDIEKIDRDIQFIGIKTNKLILNGASSSDSHITELLEKIEHLKVKKVQLLTLTGYSANYLEPVYICNLCRDTGISDGGKGYEKCSCYRQELINQLYSLSNIKLSDTENFSNFDESYYSNIADETRYGIKKSPQEHLLGIKEKCLKFIRNINSPEEKNLLFCGPAGVGKTFMANCIGTDLLNKGHIVLYQTAPRLFDIISEYKQKAYSDEAYEDISYRNIFDVELLIIDDLGTESPSAARYAELLNILNTRQMNGLKKPCKTIISTNLEPEKLFEYYTERVASRLTGSFAIYRFVGDDIRRLKKQIGI